MTNARRTCGAAPAGAIITCTALAILSLRAPASAGDCEPQWLATLDPDSAVNGGVSAMTVFDDGTGPALYVAGGFDMAGGVPANRIARWNGESWQPLGSGVNQYVLDLTEFNGDLIAAGYFTEAGGVTAHRVARWDGSEWHPLGGGIALSGSVSVNALTVYDGDLIAGGEFVFAGGAIVNNIARWDGRSWRPLGTGMGIGETLAHAWVNALTVHNGELIAAGIFETAGGVVTHSIARWDGTSWSPLVSEPVGLIFALTLYDGDLIVAGSLDDIGGIRLNRIARWDGVNWHPLGEGMSHPSGPSAVVSSLALFNGDLIARGRFTVAGGVPANYIARWDGASWHAMRPGLIQSPSALVFRSSMAEFDDGSGTGPALFVGGTLNVMPPGESFLAKWGCGTQPIAPDLNGDGVVDGLDLGILLANWSIPAGSPGCSGSLPCAADLNGDGVVDGLDLGILLANWSL